MTSLLARTHPLADTIYQKSLLAGVALARSFETSLASAGLMPLRPTGIEILQMNVGKLCNQTCHHCHVDAGPDRQEVMSDDVIDACLSVLAATDIPTLDITGGAPELHPRFRELIVRAAALHRHVMHRCNLTAIVAPSMRDIPALLAQHGVEVVASLPYYLARQTDAQRGDGVFEKSIAGLQALNALGYGRIGSGLVLDLVTNPVGAFLPASQKTLELDWRRELARRHGVEFNHLYTITNMPISRFLEFLEKTQNLDAYMTRLVNAFNPAAARNVMCRNTLSVGWDGRLYDCDFNQMLDLELSPASPRTIFEFDLAKLNDRAIVVGPHCFGCTAGAGSSCGGATT
ncbi:MAG: arsenosugar biosynthesis radical SAM (seleno)protein ArsS [Planctomycetota bacterium]